MMVISSPIKPIYELILWDNCSNNCSFCWQRRRGRFLNEGEKIKRLSAAREFLAGGDFQEGSHVLLVGGEIFDPNCANLLAELNKTYQFVADMMVRGRIDLLYINTNLLYDVDEALFPVLKMLTAEGLASRLMFTTSYDHYGRFPSETARKMFLGNLKLMFRDFPDIHKTVNVILTKQFCEHSKNLPSGSSIIRSFREGFGFDTNLIPYVSVDESMTPDRNSVFQALSREFRENPGYRDRYIRNFDLRQKKEIYDFSGDSVEYVSAPLAECGHGVNFRRYSSGGTCFVCDIKELFNA